MSATFAHFVRDATGQDFLLTFAGEEYAPRFRRFARSWMRLRHDDHTRPQPAGAMTVHVVPSELYEPA